MLTDRRSWLKQTTLAALGLGVSLKSLAGEDYLPYHLDDNIGLINLGSNENPYGISPKAKQAIINMIGEANRYQFNVASLKTFKEQVAAYYKISPEQLLITAGSGEGLALLARYFSKGNIVASTPTFNVLQGTARNIGTEVLEIPLTTEKVNDVSKLLYAINDKTELMYLVNPNNPTGTVLTPGVVNNFCEEVSQKTVVLIDEAYIDYADAPNNRSMIDLPAKNKNVLVMRTFSKIHAMAGLRIGFIVGHPDLIQKLGNNFFRSSSFCLSNLTITAALASLGDEEHRIESKKKNDAAKNYTVKALEQMGVTAIPSQTNFIFVPIKNYKGDFAQDMLAKNVLVRQNNIADGKWARISIGTMEEMQKFIPIMKAAVNA